MAALPKTFKRAVFLSQGAPLTLEEAPLRLPGKGEILVKVKACGVCHTDMYAQYNGLGGGFPMVPGHEIIGEVAALGEDVTGWSVGDGVGSGYFGGYDGSCAQCKDKYTKFCDNLAINGLNKEGGCKFTSSDSQESRKMLTSASRRVLHHPRPGCGSHRA